MLVVIAVLTGAGVSTASGIPDFRSPGGVWERFDPMEFTIQRFHADPAAFWLRRARLIAAMDYLDARPNATHEALADAALRGRVHVITQNVDGLHGKAGTPPERLIELHGNGNSTVCLGCGRREDVRTTLAHLGPGAPICACGGLLKPDVVLFGESVERMPAAIRVVEGAEALVVAGTSLQVHPAAGLVHVALASGLGVTICNDAPTPYDDACTVLRGPVTESLPRLLAAASEG